MQPTFGISFRFKTEESIAFYFIWRGLHESSFLNGHTEKLPPKASLIAIGTISVKMSFFPLGPGPLPTPYLLPYNPATKNIFYGFLHIV